MPIPVIRYPLDPTGLSPDNLVSHEQKTMVNRAVRAIAPNYGAFFTESLVVRDITNNRTLIRGVSYQCAELYEVLSQVYLKEICAVILITDVSVSSEIEISYQCLGGEYSTSSEAIVSMLNALSIDDRPANWGTLINLPDAFNPAMHLHDIGDVFGFEYLVNSIERLTSAVLTGDNASHNRIYEYIDSKLAGQSKNTNTVFSNNLDELYFFSQH